MLTLHTKKSILVRSFNFDIKDQWCHGSCLKVDVIKMGPGSMTVESNPRVRPKDRRKRQR